MDGKHEVEEKMLPTRNDRGKECKTKFEAYTDLDPRIKGWRKFKKDNFAFNRSERIAGVEYFVEKLFIASMKPQEIYDCVDNV